MVEVSNGAAFEATKPISQNEAIKAISTRKLVVPAEKLEDQPHVFAYDVSISMSCLFLPHLLTYLLSSIRPSLMRTARTLRSSGRPLRRIGIMRRP
jgi:hypothetical protein